MSDYDAHPYTLAEHASDMAALLASAWEVDGSMRSWHAEFESYRRVHVVLLQVRGMAGFEVSAVVAHELVKQRSGPGFSLAAAALWLGLDDCNTPLDWRHEL
jgi:hypothetical protein